MSTENESRVPIAMRIGFYALLLGAAVSAARWYAITRPPSVTVTVLRLDPNPAASGTSRYKGTKPGQGWAILSTTEVSDAVAAEGIATIVESPDSDTIRQPPLIRFDTVLRVTRGGRTFDCLYCRTSGKVMEFDDEGLPLPRLLPADKQAKLNGLIGPD